MITRSSQDVGLRGLMSTCIFGGGMSIGNMSTHISTFPFNREIIRLYFIKTPSRVAHLFNAGLVWVVQGPGLHVLGHQGHAHPGDLVPVVQHPQGQLLLLHLGGGRRVWERLEAVHCEHFVPDSHFVSVEVRPVHFPLLTHPGEDLARLHGISPLVVAAGIIFAREATGWPVTGVEPVLEVYLCLANQVIPAKQIPVINLDS